MGGKASTIFTRLQAAITIAEGENVHLPRNRQRIINVLQEATIRLVEAESLCLHIIKASEHTHEAKEIVRKLAIK